MKKEEALREISISTQTVMDKIRQAHENDDIHILQAVMISTPGNPTGQIRTLTRGRLDHLTFGVSDIITDVMKNMQDEDKKRFVIEILEGIKAHSPKIKIESFMPGLRKCPNTKLH